MMRLLTVMAASLMHFFGSVLADPIEDARTALRYEIGEAKSPGALLIIDITAAGHWVLSNRDDERFTAANVEELRRGFAAFGRPLGSEGSAGHVFVTTRAGLQHWQQFRDVPAKALELVNRRRIPMTLRADAPPLLLSLAGPAAVDAIESLHALDWHLLRPLGTLRILALEPGGPRSLTRSLNHDPETKDLLVDAIDPTALLGALPSLGGQIVVVSGKVDGETLRARGSKGSEATVDLLALRQTARAASIALVIRHGAGPAQPFTPRFQLLRRDPSGPAQTLSDFVRASVQSPSVIVRSGADGGVEATVALKPAGLLESAYWTRAAASMLKPLFGETPVEQLTLVLPAPERQQELQRRLVLWLPSWLQFTYAGLLLLGFVGWPTARRWFARVWPPEAAAEYGNTAGWHAARAVRATIFASVFVPLTAILSVPIQLSRLLKRTP